MPAGGAETDAGAAREETIPSREAFEPPPEQVLDDLLSLAAELCRAPLAAVTLVDERRAWFKSRLGLTVSETSRDAAFCNQALLHAGVFVLSDAHVDPSFSDHPMVIGEPHVRFYAGAPLVTSDGRAVGVVCVLDHVPRLLGREQEVALRRVARLIVAQLEGRRTQGEATAVERRVAEVRAEAERRVAQAQAEAERRAEVRASSLEESLARLVGEVEAHKEAAEALRQSEARLAAALDAASLGVWEWDLVTGQVAWHGRYQNRFGPNPARFDGTFAAFLRVVHPEDLPALRAAMETARQERLPFRHEWRLRYADGSVHWRESAGQFAYDDAGRAVAASGIVRDISAEKAAEAALEVSHAQLRALATRIDEVREEEATRIARTIHDELGQTLTALKLDVAWLVRHLEESGPDADTARRTRLDAMAAQVDATVGVVRRLATELRPSILDDLGLGPAIEWAAQEFGARSGLACDLRLEPEVGAVAPSRATALFRILQEILTNGARHAAATRIEIVLQRIDDEIQLTVRDDGCGIGAAEVAAPTSLGLLGMRERAMAVGGRVVVEGRPGDGTTVTVRVPLAPPGGGS